MLASQSQLDESYEYVEPVASFTSKPSNEVEKLARIMVGKATQKVFPKEYLNEPLRKLGNDTPARVPPMKIRLNNDVEPYKCNARKYPHEISAFMKDFNA
ncbi:hypothetical protein PHMEG_00035179 [Phytophthora megakarya]|uniref:Uncharacterized protein n=1 Tax=Phytophthora megakarya TaxID=4795 RepID=A0A225UPB0_9STRA|nr:hypothetical protein PHMEG_00035179 [Phytophthora megakarya]